MIKTGPMQLNQPEPLDPMEPFFTGTQPDGGYWQDAARLSAHDHSGGLLGAPVAVSIPDGSITAVDLDPSVLAPYALVDGSKPFTGQVTMQADAVVRDALYFGQQGTALAPDATLTRTGAGALRVDTHLGVGVNPLAWGGSARALQIGPAGAVASDTAALVRLDLSANTYHDGTSRKAINTGTGGLLRIEGSALSFDNAPSVAAGATQTTTPRLSVDAAGNTTHTGTFVQIGQGVSTAGGQVRLMDDGGTVRWMAGVQGAAAGRDYVVQDWQGGGLRLQLSAASPYVIAGGHTFPSANNTYALGDPANKWTVVYAVAGSINTSSQDLKEGITPLSPERAMQAVRATEAVTYDYVAPTRGPEWYDLPDDPEQAEAVLQQRLTAAPLEAAARHQHGFIAEQADELFLVGEGQTSPGSSIGVLLAALQNIDQRLAALETP